MNNEDYKAIKTYCDNDIERTEVLIAEFNLLAFAFCIRALRYLNRQVHDGNRQIIEAAFVTRVRNLKPWQIQYLSNIGKGL